MRWLTIARIGLLCILTTACAAHADVITDSGFENNAAGWQIRNQTGGSGDWYMQTGTTSALNGFAVPAPPVGTHAAMTDQTAAGSHSLYQDFHVPAGVISASLDYRIFINNNINHSGP